jgi:hypothetical protein
VGHRLRFARSPVGETPTQRRSMRMVRLGPFVLADLPVDRVVILEQQERTGETKGIERALPKR